MDDKKPRYETCVSCGREWNVSVNAPQGWYICPDCYFREQRLKGKKKGKQHGQPSNT